MSDAPFIKYTARVRRGLALIEAFASTHAIFTLDTYGRQLYAQQRRDIETARQWIKQETTPSQPTAPTTAQTANTNHESDSHINPVESLPVPGPVQAPSASGGAGVVLDGNAPAGT